MAESWTTQATISREISITNKNIRYVIDMSIMKIAIK